MPFFNANGSPPCEKYIAPTPISDHHRRSLRMQINRRKGEFRETPGQAPVAIDKTDSFA